MMAQRIATLVVAWVRLYTRGLPAPDAERRVAEVEADLQDHIAFERDHGAAHWRIALALLGRMVRGMPADAAWRHRALRPSLGRSARRVLATSLAILLVPFVWMQLAGGVDWSGFDFAFAAVLLLGSGLVLELAVHRPRSVAFRLAAAAIGVGAILFGAADDAPGLVLFGLLLLGATLVLSVPRRRSARGEAAVGHEDGPGDERGVG